MSITRKIPITAILSVLMLCLELGTVVADGGNVDFYRLPLSILWFVVTVVSMLPNLTGEAWAYIRRKWVLQILMPVPIFFLSSLLTAVYEPHHLGPIQKKRRQNQSVEQTARAASCLRFESATGSVPSFICRSRAAAHFERYAS